jgi:hypothetical protein
VSALTDIFITGGTAKHNKTYTLTNNTGGTFNISALTDIFVTGATYNAGTTTFRNSTGGTLPLLVIILETLYKWIHIFINRK